MVYRDKSRISPQRDRIALANDTARLNQAVQPGAVVERQIDGRLEQFLKVLAREVQPPSPQYRLADAEALANQMVEIDAARRQVAPVIGRQQDDRTGLQRRVVAGQRVQHFAFDQRDLTDIRFAGIRPGPETIASPSIPFPATSIAASSSSISMEADGAMWM
jgi:hypothetical protein